MLKAVNNNLNINVKKSVVTSVTALFLLFPSLGFSKKSAIAGIVSTPEAKKEVKETSKRPMMGLINTSPIGTHALGVGLGQTFLSGDFGINGTDAITLDIYYKYKASYSFDLLLNAHFSSHSLGQKESTILGFASGIKGKLLDLDAFTPYVIGGMGFYLPTVKRFYENNLIKSSASLTFGTHLGFGGELELNNRVTVGALFHFHNPFDIKQELAPEVEGSYYKLLITTLYSF